MNTFTQANLQTLNNWIAENTWCSFLIQKSLASDPQMEL